MKLKRVFATAAALTCSLSLINQAQAAPRTPAEVAGGATPATITLSTQRSEEGWRAQVDNVRTFEMLATSPSMDNRVVPLFVIKAPEPNRPIIYLLNGADGGDGLLNWVERTDVVDFYKDKNVNVVIPMSGRASYYTDWKQEIPHLGGKQMWETFLTRELPVAIEPQLQASNKRAIAGMSMSATTSLLFAQHQQGFYDAVASYSGCASTSSEVTRKFVGLTLNRGGATPEQMWGPVGDPAWSYNDALINAEKLRGTEVYVSSASGLPGVYDLPGAHRYEIIPQEYVLPTMVDYWVQGGVIEAAANACTHDLKAKLDHLGIPAQFNFRNSGTHSWEYWQEDLRHSWAVFDRAFNK